MIRLGLIGCGSMGPRFLEAAARLAERVEVTALVDTARERAEQVASQAPVARVATDYRDITADVDAVVIAVPHDLHYEIGLHFLRAGKHVLMEKPLANTEAQCLELIAARDAAGVVLGIGYVMRYHPLWTQFGEYLREKTFGDVFQVSIWTEQYTNADRGSWLGQRRRVGGGQLFSHGCHYIDLLMAWLGRPVEGTHLGTNLGTPWMEREGTSHVAIKFAGGALGYHFGTWGARGTALHYAVHAHCTGGMLELNNIEHTITFHRDPSGGDLPALQAAIASGATVASPERTLLAHIPWEDKPLLAELTELLDCIDAGRQPRTDARTALQTLRVIWKLYDAEDRGVVADLRGLGFDEYRNEVLLHGAGQAI